MRIIGNLSSLAYFHMPSKFPLISATIGQQLEKAVAKTPDRVFANFFQHKKVFTYEQFYKTTQNLAASLQRLGVKKGDRVGIWDINTPEWMITQYATAQIGAILVNVNPLFRAPELEHALNKVGVSVLLMRDNFKTQNFYGILSEVASEFPKSASGLGCELKLKQLPALKKVVIAGPSAALPGTCATFSELLSTPTRDELDKVQKATKETQFDDPIQIIFTSGTTGFPKGATLTHHNLINNARSIGIYMNFHEHAAVICNPVPFFHIGSCLLGNQMTITHNSTLVIPSVGFDAEFTLKAAHETKATTLYGTPTMYIDELNHPNRTKYDLSMVRCAGIGGAPAPPSLIDGIMGKMGIPEVRSVYGSTEIGVVTSSRRNSSAERMRSTVGRPLRDIETKIVDRNDRVVGRGEEGEICIRSYSTMLGYWNDEEKTKEVITPTRWYRTGDLGSFDDQGFLKISGRIRDLVIKGGRNVYPAEIEVVFAKHEKIADSSVVGVPDERLGEELCAFIRLKDGQTLTGDELSKFLENKVTKYKVPKYFIFVKEFPMTVTRKVKKYELREQAIKTLKLENVKSHFGN